MRIKETQTCIWRECGNKKVVCILVLQKPDACKD